MNIVLPTSDILNILREYFQKYGYWTVAFALLLENTGVPVPGETTLLFASFLAFSQHQLRLPIIIAVGIAAAITGDNAGYAVGHFGGRRLVDQYLHVLHVSRGAVEKGERFFERHGPVTIFFARFIAGLRIVAGPLAGTLRMPWRIFLLFNFLGATAWVTAIALIGYFFGSQLDRLLAVMGRANIVILAALILAAALWWWRRRGGHLRNEGRKGRKAA